MTRPTMMAAKHGVGVSHILLPIERTSCDARIVDGIGFRSILYFLTDSASHLPARCMDEMAIGIHKPAADVC